MDSGHRHPDVAHHYDVIIYCKHHNNHSHNLIYITISVCHWAYTESTISSHQINSENVETDVRIRCRCIYCTFPFCWTQLLYRTMNWFCMHAQMHIVMNVSYHFTFAHTLGVLVWVSVLFFLFLCLPISSKYPLFRDIIVSSLYYGCYQSHTRRMLYLVNSRLAYVMSWPNFSLLLSILLHAMP